MILSTVSRFGMLSGNKEGLSAGIMCAPAAPARTDACSASAEHRASGQLVYRLADRARTTGEEPAAMKQRTLGPQGPAVSAIGLGCMGMSAFYGATDEAESLRTIE